jgi:hypothetical protein
LRWRRRRVLLFDRLRLRRPNGLALNVWDPRIRLRLQRFERLRDFNKWRVLHSGLNILHGRALGLENPRKIMPALNNVWRKSVCGR